MNERILELYQQAYDSIYEFQAGMLVLGPVEKKFAELIVKECASIAREIGNNTEPDDFALDRCYEIEDQIREHWGVDV